MYPHSSIIQEYIKLYPSDMTDSYPPAYHLLEIVKRSNKLPSINRVVDCYNLSSLQTGLSIGAHDTHYIIGNIMFDQTTGGEKYTPLGSENEIAINPGEYCCMDDEKVLCRMDIKQCDQTKVNSQTKQCFIYVQGNKATPIQYLKDTLITVCDDITLYCAGKYQIYP